MHTETETDRETAASVLRATRTRLYDAMCPDFNDQFTPYHTIPHSFNNVADIRNLQQYCSMQHYQSGRTTVHDSYIVKET